MGVGIGASAAAVETRKIAVQQKRESADLRVRATEAGNSAPSFFRAVTENEDLSELCSGASVRWRNCPTSLSRPPLSRTPKSWPINSEPSQLKIAAQRSLAETIFLSLSI